MPEWFRQGGYIMWPVLLAAIAAAVLAVRSWLGLRATRAQADPVLETRIDAVLFWGGWAAVVGVLGTLVGIAMAARAIERIGRVSESLVWGGIRVALIPTVFGLLVLIVALVVWFALRVAYRRGMPATT